MSSPIIDTAAASALAPIEPSGILGVVPNKQHQKAGGVFPQADYDLAIVEFDDQGRCYDRRQMDAVAAKIESLTTRDAIVVVFVHGWKRNAKTDDDNLQDFLVVLGGAVRKEREASAETGASPRPVLGVFIGWRGLSLYDRAGILDNLTFWDRQQAARRVAVGSVRELLGRLRTWRNARIAQNGKPLFVVVGHSFGGMVVFSALAQSLIEAATTPGDEVVPGFADLVLLVNPAFEAGRYMPIQDLVEARRKSGKSTRQPPVFVSATAKNDWATGIAFPISNALSLVTEAFRGWQELGTAVRTLGHVPWMLTHTLEANGGEPGYRRVAQTEDDDSNPFWIVQAAPEVIDGHNGIFMPRFLNFVADLVFAHVRKSKHMSFSLPHSG